MSNRFLHFLATVLLLTGCEIMSTDSYVVSPAEIVASVGMVGETVAGANSLGDGSDDRFNCVNVAYGSCANAQRHRTFNGCLRGSLAVHGSSILVYPTLNCVTSTLSPVRRVLNDHYLLNESGEKILIYTDTGVVGDKTLQRTDLLDYEGKDRSGGSTMTSGQFNTDTLTIAGIHRRQVKASGEYGFWLTLYASKAIDVARGSGNWTIESGEMTLLSNRSRAKISETFSKVVFHANCCYPTSGSITFSPNSSSAAGFSAFTATFSATCGQVSIGEVTTTLPACAG